MDRKFFISSRKVRKIYKEILASINFIFTAIQITDDVTTPLRQGEEETSSVDGNRYLMNEYKNGSVGDI